MNPLHFLPSLFFLLGNSQTLTSNYSDQFTLCKTSHYKCGSIEGITYPFWGENVPSFCGHSSFKITCLGASYPVFDIGNHSLHLLNIDQANYAIAMSLAFSRDATCSPIGNLHDVIDSNHLFHYTASDGNLILAYGCPSVPSMSHNNFTCTHFEGNSNYYADESTWEREKQHLNECEAFSTIPVYRYALNDLITGSTTVSETVSQGFELRYSVHREVCAYCEKTGGICGSDLATDNFLCFQSNKSPNPSASPGIAVGILSKSYTNLKMSLIGIAIAAGAGIVCSCIIIAFCFRSIKRRVNSNKLTNICLRTKTKNDENIKIFIRHYASVAPRRYSYSDIKKMTNSFKEKLGHGGYGSVYKGRLLDGHLVAVKVLNASKGNGEEFINEVASISQTSHVNIVSLLGFSFEDRRKALVYEFMPNGSLERFIRNKENSESCFQLPRQDLYQIALGIARGLDYLHRGCNMRILHLDIKPQNILLDEDFCPKIADFGLSKLCSRKESIISLKDARGTIGYIAPEVYSRNFGRVSNKSDVYSYGMMILEMVSGRKNTNINVDNASKVYFPHWAYNRLQHGYDLGLHCAMTEEENEVVTKMVLVGLWCTQTKPSDRPPIHEVITMLEGSIGSIRFPPNSFMFSPPETLSS